MHKDAALAHIQNHLSPEERLIGFFAAQRPMKFWLFFLIGPLAALSAKAYYLGVTDKGVHFHALNLLGKFSQHDFFAYDEIANVKIGSGMLQIPMKFTFKNGRKLTVRAQKKGLDRVAKIDEQALAALKQNIAQS